MLTELKITKEQVDAFTQDPFNQALAAEYLCLTAAAAVKQKEMDLLYKPIFDKYEFFDDEGNRIAYEDDALFTSDQDELVAQYFAEIDQARRNAGYDLPKGHCPALKAAHAVVLHERKILEAMTRLLGVDCGQTYGDLRQKSVDLFMRTVIAGVNESCREN